MTLTKRDIVTRISQETGLNQIPVFDLVQKILDGMHHRRLPFARGVRPNDFNFLNLSRINVVEKEPPIGD